MNIKLDKFREEINYIDDFLVYLLFKRIEIVKKIGELKKKDNIPLYVPEREKVIINRCIIYAQKYNISPKFIELIFTNILNESKIIEKQYISLEE